MRDLSPMHNSVGWWRAAGLGHNRAASNSPTPLAVNDLFVMLGIESWKPVLSAMLLPPVPLLLLALVAARLILWRRVWGWLLMLSSVTLLWLTACSAVGEWMQQALLAPPPAFGKEQIAQLRRAVAARQPVVIVVLGAGREALAPEYGVASLRSNSLERLRYGLWLGRETGAPVAFSGGTGHAQSGGASEAEVAAAIAAREFGRPLRWVEDQSRDTRENGLRTTALLRSEGITQLVLVTHGWHMARSLRAFTDAARHANAGWRVVPAPMGLGPLVERPTLRWLPSSEGFKFVRQVVREKIGWWLGA